MSRVQKLKQSVQNLNPDADVDYNTFDFSALVERDRRKGEIFKLH